MFPVSIRRIYAGRHIWQADKAVLPPRNFKRFSITAGSCGVAGPERWRVWAWRVPTRCRRKHRKAPMPMPPGATPSPPFKDFLALWKDADPDPHPHPHPDIPILKEAKAEYSKLQ